MRRLILSSSFCIGLLLFGAWVMMPVASAQREDTLAMLLRLPAPPPPNPLVPPRDGPRSDEFFDENTPPPDNAPIADLLAYWERMNSRSRGSLDYIPQPSDRVRSRLTAEIERDPYKLSGLINIFRDDGDSARFVYNIYRRLEEDPASRRSERQSIRDWLKYNSPYFADELARAASAVRDTGEYVRNHEDLLALTRHDWERASPIVNDLYNDMSQPVSRALATWALYRRASVSNSPGDTERYRSELIRMVEDRSASAAVRDLAMDALVLEPEWPGRDDWYFSLLSDETLAELRIDGQLYTGLTTLILRSPVERYRGRMIELAASDDRIVRNAAVRNLVAMLRRGRDESIVRALLPWLSDPEWAKEVDDGRRVVITSLSSLKIPESVPGLIALLNERTAVPDVFSSEEDLGPYGANMAVNVSPPAQANAAARAAINAARAVARAAAMAANTAANGSGRSANANANVGSGKMIYIYPHRSNALSALAHQRDVRAAPAIRAIMGELEDWERAAAVRTLLVSGGYSIPEQVDALEHVIRTHYIEILGAGQRVQEILVSRGLSPDTLPGDVSPQIRKEIEAELAPLFEKAFSRRSELGSDPRFALGTAVEQLSEPDDELVRAIVRRIEDLDEKEREVTDIYRNILTRWSGPAVNSMLLSDLRRGRSDSDGVVKMLALRKELREDHASEVHAALDGGPLARGIAACILEDRMLVGSAIEAGGESAVAALACSRLIRFEMPVQQVVGLLDSRDTRLALAAERYLEAEDSPEARMALYRLHPGKAKIYGSTVFFSPGEEAAVFSHHLPDLFSSVSGGAADDHAIYSPIFQDGLRQAEAKLREMVLADNALLGLYSFDRKIVRIFADRVEFRIVDDDARYRERILKQDEFDRLRGYLSQHSVDEMPPYLSCRAGCVPKQLTMLGRAGGRRIFFQTDVDPDFVVGLEAIFADMARAPMQLKYAAGEHIAGLELVFADDEKWAETVWAGGGEVRALITDREARRNIESEISRLYDSDFDEDDFDGEYDEDDISPVPAVPEDQEEPVAPEPEPNPYLLAAEQREKRRWEGISWWSVSGGKAAQPSGPPPGILVPVPPDQLDASVTADAWKTRVGQTEVRIGEDGIFRLQQGKMARIVEGTYSSPVLSANGRWLAASKYEYEVGYRLVRIDLANGREYPVEGSDDETAVCFIPALNRFLLISASDDHFGYRGRDNEYMGELPRPSRDLSERSFSLLNPDNGQIQNVVGEYRPLAQQTFRPLQQAGSPHEFWAAIPSEAGTEVGIYDSRLLGFRRVATIPKISFISMDMWIDGGLIYFVYKGHILSVPLSSEQTK